MAGEESNGKGFMLPASKLLKIIDDNGVAAADGVTRVLHDPTQPEFVESHFGLFGPGEEARLEPNFTEANISVLQRALEITHEIRHAREVSEQPSEELSEEHLEALKALGDYPEFSQTILDEAIEDYEAHITVDDGAEQASAARYLEALGEDEQADVLPAGSGRRPIPRHPSNHRATTGRYAPFGCTGSNPKGTVVNGCWTTAPARPVAT